MSTPSSCPGKPNLSWKFSVSFLCFVLDLQFLTPGLQPSLLVTSLFIPIPHICLLCCSVTKSCPVLCDPHGLQHTLGSSVLQCLPEFAQTRIHWVGDAIQPSHSLSSPSPPAFNLSQHQGLFQWVSSSHQVAKVLELQLQHQSFH